MYCTCCLHIQCPYQICNQVLYVPFMQDGRNALHLAAQRGHIKTIQYLAPKMDALLHSTDHQGFTMLHLAAEKGHAEVVRVLLEDYKLDPTAHDKVNFDVGFKSICESHQ